jgi:hypothetical protein
VIHNELKAFIESGVSVVAGTRDAALVPEITRAWGPQVSEDRQSVSLCVPLATSRKMLDNLESNGQIAVAFSLPSNYKTVQLKGRAIEIAEPSGADLAAVERHRNAFGSVNEPIGVPRRDIETFWRRELETSPAQVTVRLIAEQIFDQTPGPGAGSLL